MNWGRVWYGEMKIGGVVTRIAAYLNKEFFDTGDAFGTVKELGFEAVEIPETHFPPPEGEEEEAQLKASLEACGLKSWWHTLSSHNRYFGSKGRARRERNIERMLWKLELAHRMGREVL